MLRIRTFGDPVLRQAARPVTDFDDALERLVDEMLETMYDAPGVGLAAPQVGIEKAFFVYDIGDGPGVLCNPQIVETSGAHRREEGCLSVPGFWFEVERPEWVVARGVDIKGDPSELSGEGLMARMLAHEIDHLNGELLIDRLEKAERKAALKEIRQVFEFGGGGSLIPPRHGERKA
ncbi:MAG: peptide deformylase [Acidobacteria bacterium]|nr:MAG: peptide deformylase [Acidobacteriota bacterium]